MADESIEGLLKNLKKTLDSDGDSPKNGQKKTQKDVNTVPNMSAEENSVFVLKTEKRVRDKDLLKENVISKVECEVTRFIVDFCSSDEGMGYIKGLIAKVLDEQQDYLRALLRDEVAKQIQDILASK